MVPRVWADLAPSRAPALACALGFHEGPPPGTCPGVSAFPVPLAGSRSSFPCNRRLTVALDWNGPALRFQFGEKLRSLLTSQPLQAGGSAMKMEAWVAFCSLLCWWLSPLLPFRAGGVQRDGFREGLLDEGEWGVLAWKVLRMRARAMAVAVPAQCRRCPCLTPCGAVTCATCVEPRVGPWANETTASYGNC